MEGRSLAMLQSQNSFHNPILPAFIRQERTTPTRNFPGMHLAQPLYMGLVGHLVVNLLAAMTVVREPSETVAVATVTLLLLVRMQKTTIGQMLLSLNGRLDPIRRLLGMLMLTMLADTTTGFVRCPVEVSVS